MALSPQAIGIIAIIVLLILMMLRVPVAYGMMAVGLLGMAVLRGFPAGIQTVVTTLYSKFTSYSYSPIPMFILMGYLLYYSGMLETLFDFARKWIGHMHGGLVSAGVLGGAAFGAVCGSGNAASATLSRVVVPELLKAKTDRSLAFGAIASAGILAPLIPPSVIAMLIAVVLEVSIGKVLIGGLVPGLLIALIYIIYITILVARDNSKAPISKKSTWKERFKSLPRIWDFLVIVILVIGGIYSGKFSATEAGAIASTAAVIILVIKRKFSFKILRDALVDTMRTTGSAFFIVGTAFVFGSFLTLTRLPNIFAQWLVELPIPPLAIILLVMVFFLIVGMFMDVMSVIYITVPILAPTVTILGYDLVWFAVILLMLTAVAAITPPFGASLFVMRASIEDSTMKEIYKGVTPFVLLTILCIVICILFPRIVLFIPDMMY